MPQYAMGDLEPPDETAWHLAIEAYGACGDLAADAVDWVGTATLSSDLLEHIIDEFSESSQFITNVEDRLAGEQ